MNNKGLIVALGLLLVVTISAVGMIVLRVDGVRPPVNASASGAQIAQVAPAQVNAAQVAGDYSGAVQLQVMAAGLYSDTLPTQPITGTPNLGSIDLSLSISQTGNVLTGYVSLDKTLVFSAQHTIQANGTTLAIGPYVNGSFDGTNLTLVSERVATVLGGQSISRQFRLIGVISQSDGSQLSGEYRETLWGAARQPVTVIGAFTLGRTVFAGNAPNVNNNPPDVVADLATTTQGTAITINVLVNDSDANTDPLTITAVSKPQFGTATTDGQTVLYTPNATFIGADTFTYYVSDGKGGVAAGTVTITVTDPSGGTNQPPTATADNATTQSGVSLLIPVLANDTDPNGDALTITIDRQPSHGTAQVENGQIRYTPNPGFTGTDTFTYIIADGKGGTASATVMIMVTDSSQPTGTSVYFPVIRR
jgi:hypothetical protein